MLLGRSREGAWIEMVGFLVMYANSRVAPVRERGLKYRQTRRDSKARSVAPVRERGLKCPMPMFGTPGMMVAPVRERGLKF